MSGLNWNDIVLSILATCIISYCWVKVDLVFSVVEIVPFSFATLKTCHLVWHLKGDVKKFKGLKVIDFVEVARVCSNSRRISTFVFDL